MSIRAATIDDLGRVVEMGAKFHAMSESRFGYDEDAASSFAKGLIEGDAGAVFLSDHGVIGGALTPAYCCPAWVFAVELFWWAEKDGLALLRRFEEWAKEMGANEVRMTSLASLPRADAVLRRKGYEQMEISYSKVVT